MRQAASPRAPACLKLGPVELSATFTLTSGATATVGLNQGHHPTIDGSGSTRTNAGDQDDLFRLTVSNGGRVTRDTTGQTFRLDSLIVSGPGGPPFTSKGGFWTGGRFRPHCRPGSLAQSAAASLSCVFVSKSLASWRSCNWLEGSPERRLTMRPRFTAGRSRSMSAQRWTFL